jgi:predicted PurR-regulated permease PerM
VGPIAGLSAFIIDETGEGAAFVADTLRSEGVEGLVAKLPPGLEHTVRAALDTLREHTGNDLRKTVQTKANEQAASVATMVGSALAATWAFAFDAAMMLIALFFFLVSGDEFVEWLDRTLPLREGQTLELLNEFKKTSYAIVVATLVTAAAQALAALAGYWIARVPHPIFFATITFFGAFIPAVGAASFSLLAAGILLVTGHPYFALFLAIWAVTVVALIDNVVKPLVLRGGMDMPSVVAFFSLIGGLAAFGPMGLLLGPLAVAFFAALLRLVQPSAERD